MKNDIIRTQKGYFIDNGDGTAHRYVYDGLFKRIGEPVSTPNGGKVDVSIVRIKPIGVEQSVDKQELTKKEIMEKLDDAGVEYDGRSKKADLLEILGGVNNG